MLQEGKKEPPFQMLIECQVKRGEKTDHWISSCEGYSHLDNGPMWMDIKKKKIR